MSRELTPRSSLSSLVCDKTNTSLTSCFKPRYENEPSCTIFIVKITFHSSTNKTNFHMKSFPLSLTFVMRFKATRKWPLSETFITTTRSGLRLGRYRTSKLLKLSKGCELLQKRFTTSVTPVYVAKCNLGEVKIETSAGQRCPHGRGTWGWLFHFVGAPGFLQLTCLCQFISHLFTCRSLCCPSLLLPVPPTLW